MLPCRAQAGCVRHACTIRQQRSACIIFFRAFLLVALHAGAVCLPRLLQLVGQSIQSALLQLSLLAPVLGGRSRCCRVHNFKGECCAAVVVHPFLDINNQGRAEVVHDGALPRHIDCRAYMVACHHRCADGCSMQVRDGGCTLWLEPVHHEHKAHKGRPRFQFILGHAQRSSRCAAGWELPGGYADDTQALVGVLLQQWHKVVRHSCRVHEGQQPFRGALDMHRQPSIRVHGHAGTAQPLRRKVKTPQHMQRLGGREGLCHEMDAGVLATYMA
mmetsp:Transcript_14191/g.38469  ORF Transcript_14191/g.38469 Transcript_14191/m.38469 type:complete len:273 (+) Transcript_14191:1973-2791(+)